MQAWYNWSLVTFLEWLLLLPWRPLPPPPPWLATCSPFPYGCGIFSASSSVQAIMVTLPRCLSFFHSSPLACYLSVYLSIYLSVYLWISLLFWCLWIIQTILHIQTLSLSLSLSLLHLLSLYLSRSLPPSLNGAMVPIVVQLWYYMQYRILTYTPQKDVSFSAYLSVEFGTTHVLRYLSTLQCHQKTVTLDTLNTQTALSFHRDIVRNIQSLISIEHFRNKMSFFLWTLTCIMLESNIWHLLSQTAIRFVENGNFFLGAHCVFSVGLA